MLEASWVTILKSMGTCPIGNHWGFNPKAAVWKYFQEIVRIFNSIGAKMILNNPHFQKQLKHSIAKLSLAFKNSLVAQRNLFVSPSP